MLHEERYKIFVKNKPDLQTYSVIKAIRFLPYGSIQSAWHQQYLSWKLFLLKTLWNDKRATVQFETRNYTITDEKPTSPTSVTDVNISHRWTTVETKYGTQL